MRTLAPPTARGWEVVAGDAMWNWTDELAELPDLLYEKVRAPSVMPGPTDLVIDPTNLWLTIHESIGHATEYDRAIGYEAAYAGTSFATPDKLGTMHYGSPVMNVTADRTVEYGLASVGFDDEGVRAQRWDLVRDGTFVGYQLDRVFAPRLGVARSNGCSYADSPHHVPIQRMANVSLQPGADDLSTEDLISRVEDGIYIVGDKSWSIDMQRYNFQFTGQRFFRIRDGRLDGQLRDVAYESVTRHATVISIVRHGNTAHVGSVRSSDVDPTVIADLVAASQQTALSAPEARDSAPPLPGSDVPADWDAPVPWTGAQVFAGLAGSLAARGFRGPDQLYGYARHVVETTFVATSHGLRRRYTQPTGSVEINAKRDGASAWAGVSTPDFVDVPTDSLLEQLSPRLGWG